MFGVQVTKDGQVLTGHYESDTKLFKFFLINNWYYCKNIEDLWDIWSELEKDIKV